MELQQLTLEKIGGGMVPELFEMELARVLENIEDPNRVADAPRSITVHLKIKPTPERDAAAISVDVSSKLAATKPRLATAFMGREQGKLVAYLRDPRQHELPLNNVVALQGGADDQRGD